MPDAQRVMQQQSITLYRRVSVMMPAFKGAAAAILILKKLPPPGVLTLERCTARSVSLRGKVA